MKSILSIIMSLAFSISSQASKTNSLLVLEEKITGQVAKQLSQQPAEIISQLSTLHPKQNFDFLKGYMNSGEWGEIPKVEAKGKTLVMKFSDGTILNVELTNMWKNKYKINDYEIDLTEHKTPSDKINYLRRVVQTKVLNKKAKFSFWSFLIQESEASVGCNKYLSSGCIEISAAVTAWLSTDLASEAITRDCNLTSNKKEILACTDLLGKYPQVKNIQEISKILAQSPNTSVTISCDKGALQEITINDESLPIIGDYVNIPLKLDPNHKLTEIPNLAKKCCKRYDGYEEGMNDICENFVNNKIGNSSTRKSFFKGKDLKNNGEYFDGAQ